MDMSKEHLRQEIARRLVSAEVIYNVSSLMGDLLTLASSCNTRNTSLDYDDLMSLYSRTDYVDAAEEAGYQFGKDCLGDWVYRHEDEVPSEEEQAEEDYDDETDGNWSVKSFDTKEDCARHVCEENNIEPYEHEVYEHWLVTDWLARKLAEMGEITGEVCGLDIWGRCTTGQAIALDHQIQELAIEYRATDEELKALQLASVD